VVEQGQVHILGCIVCSAWQGKECLECVVDLLSQSPWVNLVTQCVQLFTVLG